MTNYLNQIESDLYKLNSMTDGSGEVVEMVAELKKKYQKSEAWDELMAEIERVTEEAAVKGLPPKTTLINKVIAVTMAKKKYESGESND